MLVISQYSHSHALTYSVCKATNDLVQLKSKSSWEAEHGITINLHNPFEGHMLSNLGGKVSFDREGLTRGFSVV